MPRVRRTDIGGYVYHVLNRANARVPIFDDDKDYKQFEDILEEAVEKYNMRLLSYSLMPNHWHLVLYPKNNGDLGVFIGWLTNTHTRRWHTKKKTVGQGHLYQGRYKSFLCQKDDHLLNLIRYVERNAKKANIVNSAENWKWSSVWRREKGTDKHKKLLSSWPIAQPKNYLEILNQPQTMEEEKTLEKSITKDVPYGSKNWVVKIVKKFGLEQVLRGVGRPRKSKK